MFKIGTDQQAAMLSLTLMHTHTQTILPLLLTMQ